ncbi:MAG: nucleotide pyrophosphohydrolase, partial [Candidatus Thorarchaeota archaeon]
MTSERSDSDNYLSFFKEEVKSFIQERNWGQYHTPKNLAQALSVETAELLEIF